VVNPLADEIQQMIMEEIKSKIHLRRARGFLFFYKRILVIFFALVFFWGILLPSLPVDLDSGIPISLSVLAALLLGLGDVLLSVFLYSKRPRLSLLLFPVLFATSLYVYSPLFRFLYRQISAFLSQILMLVSLVAVPLILGKSFHSMSGKPKMSRKRSFIHCYVTGLLLEISCLCRFLWVGLSLVVSLALPLFLQFRVYDSVLPPSEMEMTLKKKVAVFKEEDKAYRGYHYSILSIYPFLFVRAFGDKTLLMKFKAINFPLEEQLHMLLFSQKEIKAEYNVFLTGFDEEAIESHDEFFVSIKNVSRKTHGVKFGLTLPATAKKIRFRDYFDEVSYVVGGVSAACQTATIEYREPNYRNQLVVLKCSFDDRISRRKSGAPQTSVAREILLETGNLTAFPLKHLRYTVVSQCEIEFVEALPRPSEFEKKRLVWSFDDLKPNEGKNVRIKFEVRYCHGKEV